MVIIIAWTRADFLDLFCWEIFRSNTDGLIILSRWLLYGLISRGSPEKWTTHPCAASSAWLTGLCQGEMMGFGWGRQGAHAMRFFSEGISDLEEFPIAFQDGLHLEANEPASSATPSILAPLFSHLPSSNPWKDDTNTAAWQMPLFCCRHPKNQRWGCRKILFQGIVEPPSNPWIYLWYRRMLFLLRMPITMQVFRKSSNRFHPPLLPWHPWSIVQRGRILLPKESRGGSTYGTTHQGTPCGHRRSVEGDKYFSCSPQWSSGGRLSKWLIVFQWSSQGEHRLPEARRFSRTLGSISSRSRV